MVVAFVVGTFVGVFIVGLFAASAYDKGREDEREVAYREGFNNALGEDR